MGDTDKNWKSWGAQNPYFGVLTSPEYSGSHIDENREKFFASGRAYVEGMVLKAIRHIDPLFMPSVAVDYGCGVGRLAIPMAQATGCTVVGLDVSEAILKEANRIAPESAARNRYLRADSGLTNLPGSYDLVYSALVFQHIDVNRGYAIADMLLRRLQPGGFAALHFTVKDISPTWRKGLRHVHDGIPVASKAFNMLRRRPLSAPTMEMHMYDLGRVLRLYHDNGIVTVECHMAFTAPYYSVLAVGKKLAQS